MKKILTLALSLSLMLVLLCSCGTGNANTPPSQHDKAVYDALNAMASLTYPEVNVDVETTLRGTTLHSRFEAKTEGDITTVTYTREHLATFEEGKPLPEHRIETTEGSFTVVDGKIQDFGEGNQDYTFSSLSSRQLSFKAEYFSKVVAEDGSFSANVENPTAFLGNSSLVAQNMTVSVLYSNALESMVITYTNQSGGLVTITYTFS